MNSDNIAKIFCIKYEPYSNSRVYMLFKSMFSGNKKAKLKLKILKNKIIKDWQNELTKLFNPVNVTVNIIIKTSFSRSHKSRTTTAHITICEGLNKKIIEVDVLNPKEDDEDYKYQRPSQLFDGTLDEYKNTSCFDQNVIRRLNMFLDENNIRVNYLSTKLNSI